MKFRKLIIVVFTAFVSALSSAQTSDMGGIATVGLSKDLGESMSVGLCQELRFNQNFSNLDRSLTGVEMDYSLIRKLLKIEGGYDFIYQNRIDYFEVRHRAAIGFSLQRKFSPFTFKLRTKLQSTWRDELRGDYKFNPKAVWRNKLECEYSIFGSSWKPFASAEIFSPLNQLEEGLIVDGYRAVLGAKYKMSSRNSIEFLVRLDQDIQQKNPQRMFYGGIGWQYKL